LVWREIRAFIRDLKGTAWRFPDGPGAGPTLRLPGRVACPDAMATRPCWLSLGQNEVSHKRVPGFSWCRRSSVRRPARLSSNDSCLTGERTMDEMMRAAKGAGTAAGLRLVLDRRKSPHMGIDAVCVLCHDSYGSRHFRRTTHCCPEL